MADDCKNCLVLYMTCGWCYNLIVFDVLYMQMDCRKIEDPSNRWSIESDVESLAWDPHNEHCFVVSLSLPLFAFSSVISAWDSSPSMHHDFVRICLCLYHALHAWNVHLLLFACTLVMIWVINTIFFPFSWENSNWYFYLLSACDLGLPM